MSARPRKLLRLSFKVLALLVLFAVTSAAGTLGYFHYAPPSRTCASCHEMQSHIDQWASSAHQRIHCRQCHGGTLTLDVHALRQHSRRLVGHFGGGQSQDLRLDHAQVLAVSQRCQSCHTDQAQRWKTGRHSATYQTIFTNAAYDNSVPPNDDCLRCHGMFYSQSTSALVMTVRHPTHSWTLQDAALADQPTMPCLACHQLHVTRPAAGPTTRPAPAALYSRHERIHFAADQLPIPAMVQDSRPLRISTDPRQRLCMQCHAPNAAHVIGSSDDRTPTGVHEGLSCLDCHDPHSATAPPNTCTTCHAGKTLRSPQKKVHAGS